METNSGIYLITSSLVALSEESSICSLITILLFMIMTGIFICNGLFLDMGRDFLYKGFLRAYCRLKFWFPPVWMLYIIGIKVNHL